MSCRFVSIIKSQRGFTLNEMLVSIGIVGLIAPAIGMAIFQVFSANALSSAHITAVKQAENAIYRISRDAQMSQTVQRSGGSGFPLNLTWVEWNGTSNNVTYTIQNNEFWRAYSVNGTQPTSIMVAQYINTDSGATNCQFANGVLNFKVTISVGGFKPVNETRTCEVVPKPQ